MPLLSSFVLPFAMGLAHAEPAVERRLYSDRVEASSFLWNDWNRFQENYHPLYAVDEDPTTAWVEGAPGAGQGAWIRFHLTELEGASAVRLRIRSGYQKSAALRKANARPKEVVVTLLPGGVETRATLTDADGFQELVLSQPPGPLEGVQLAVDTVYPGSKYEDLCISDVEIYATATTRDNPVVEKAKLERALAWKRERVEAAKLMKGAAAGSLPIAGAYSLRAEAEEIPYKADETGFYGFAETALAALISRAPEPGLPVPIKETSLALEGLRSRFSEWKPVQAVATDTRPIPPVDGLAPASIWNCFEGPPVWGDASTGEASGNIELPVVGQLGYLKAEGVGTFDLSGSPTVEQAMGSVPAACNRETPHTYAWAKLRPATAEAPARLEALFTVTCGTVEAREGMEQVAVPQVLVYDEAGRLSLLINRRSATAFGWRGEGASAVLSEARRVAVGDVTVRLSEGRLAANP